jgi:hypothetical protein
MSRWRGMQGYCTLYTVHYRARYVPVHGALPCAGAPALVTLYTVHFSCSHGEVCELRCHAGGRAAALAPAKLFSS